MKQFTVAAILFCALSIPANAQSLVNDARIEALADLVAYAEQCDLRIDKGKMGSFVSAEFADTAEALKAMRTNVYLAQNKAESSSEIERMVTCPLLRQFADENTLISASE